MKYLWIGVFPLLYGRIQVRMRVSQIRWRRLSTGSIELQQLTCTARKLGYMAALGRYRSLYSQSPLSIRGSVDHFPWQTGGSVVDDPWSFESHQGPFRSLTFPPVLRDWVIKGFGMSSLVYATGHIKDPVPLVEKSRGLSPGGRFPPSFIHQVVIITGLNKLQLYVLALKMALDADRA